MNRKTNTLFYETIEHKTDAAPYSIHHTTLPADCTLALYLHWHNELEFLVLHQGQLHFQVEDKFFIITAGQGIFIPPGLLHSAENIGYTPISFSAFVLSPTFFISDLQSHAYKEYILPVLHNNLPLTLAFCREIPWQKELLSHLNTILLTTQPRELFVRGHGLLLWDLLYTEHIRKLGVRPTLDTLAKHMMPVLDYIHSHYHQCISLNTLADMVHLSEGQFCRSFKHFTGMTPFQYINRYRILQSCQELNHTDKKITEIALNHGYNNISYYNRAFLKVMNMTPSEYRKRKNC